MNKVRTGTATLFAAIIALTALVGGAAAPAQAAEHCRVAEECHGLLPQLCKRCGDGRDGCAHWACVRHTCVIAYCNRR